MDKLLNHIIVSLCAEKGYSHLFKAGVVLIGTALLAMSQTGTFLYEKDLSAHKAKFTLETTLKQPLEKMDCSKLATQQVDCLVAKHEMSILNSSLEFLDSVVQTSLWFGVLLAVLSCVGFLCAPFVNANSNAGGAQT